MSTWQRTQLAVSAIWAVAGRFEIPLRARLESDPAARARTRRSGGGTSGSIRAATQAGSRTTSASARLSLIEHGPVARDDGTKNGLRMREFRPHDLVQSPAATDRANAPRLNAAIGTCADEPTVFVAFIYAS